MAKKGSCLVSRKETRGRWNFRGWSTFLRDEFLQEEEGIVEEGSLKLSGAGGKNSCYTKLRNSYRVIYFLRLWTNIYIYICIYRWN